MTNEAEISIQEKKFGNNIKNKTKAKKYNTKKNNVSITKNKKSLSIVELSGLIKKSSFVIANDTGPAHITAHVGAKGLTLFGKHTTAYKVSIERENFKPIQVSDLNNLTAEKVFEKLVDSLS